VLFVWKEEVFILPGNPAISRTPWRPGRRAAALFAGLLLTVVIFGGYVVQVIDKQSAQLGGGHSGHFGTPVDSGGSSY